jgi:hypothetical protein
MCVRCPEPGTSVSSFDALGSARSGIVDDSIRWIQ